MAFSGNRASFGGAMFNDGYAGNSSPTLRGITYSGNVGDGDGGVLYNYGNEGGISSPVLVNVTFSGNTGIAMINDGYNGASNAMLSFVTFSGNNAADCGGALWNYDGSHVSINHTILWGDSATTGSEVCNVAGATTTVTNSIAQGSGGSGIGWNASFGSDGGGNLDADPKLDALKRTDGFTQTRLPIAGSAAIDAASNCKDVQAISVATDQRGVSRPQLNACDIGAVEVTATDQDRIFKDGFGS